MTNEQKRLVSALLLSHGRDPERFPQLVHPFYQKEWCVATDNKHLIRVKRDLIPDSTPGVYERRFPNTANIIPSRQELNETITKDRLSKILEQVPKTSTVECGDFHGSGEVVFSYLSMDGEKYQRREACPVCGGCGEVEIGFPVMIRMYPCNIKDVLVPAGEIAWLNDILSILNAGKITLRSVTSKEGRNDRVYFTVNDNIDIMIMGMLPADKDEDGAVTYEGSPVRIV